MGILGNLVPLVILFTVVGGGAFVGYQIYLFSQQMGTRAKNHMERKNVSFTNGGMKVGVREKSHEQEADKTQSVLVNVWNNAELPNYKSRLGWNSTQGSSSSGKKDATAQRPGVQHTASTTSTTSSSGRLTPGPRPAIHRSGSSVPGSFD